MVVCNDLAAWKEFVMEKRGIDKSKKLTEKFSIDGGGDHFKICANLIEEKPKLSSPKKSFSQSDAAKKLKDSREKSEATKQKTKDTAVTATYLLAVAENIPETRENVKIVLDRLGLSKIEVGDCIAADYKLINILVGIQGHQASCPCAYCEWPKNDQFNCSAKERDFEGIR